MTKYGFSRGDTETYGVLMSQVPRLKFLSGPSTTKAVDNIPSIYGATTTLSAQPPFVCSFVALPCPPLSPLSLHITNRNPRKDVLL